MIKIKLCVWFHFGKPEIKNCFAYVTRLNNGYYNVYIPDGCNGPLKFAIKERYFYMD